MSTSSIDTGRHGGSVNPGLGAALALGRRSLNEAIRTPEALVPSLFIPLFFLVVNIGQVSKIFPSGTPWLSGQNYAAFQIPASVLLAASFSSAAMFPIEDIEGGYFDKLRATPISRTALISARLYAEFVKSLVLSAVTVAISFAFGVNIESGILGLLLLCAMAGVWAVVYSGFMQLVALKRVRPRQPSR